MCIRDSTQLSKASMCCARCATPPSPRCACPLSLLPDTFSPHLPNAVSYPLSLIWQSPKYGNPVAWRELAAAEPVEPTAPPNRTGCSTRRRLPLGSSA
eukprot:3721951-Prymnesium_polylepis.1